jgi:hypothetical protein
MRIIRSFLFAAVGAFALGAAPRAFADDVKADGRVVVFGDNVAKFNVSTDTTGGTMTFRLADPSVKIASAPVVVLQTESGPKEVTLTAVEGQPGTWRLSHELVRSRDFRGSMKIVVDNKPYTADLVVAGTAAVPATETRWVARHGGSLLQFSDCGASVEAVQDPATGTITIWSPDDVKIVDAPVVMVSTTTEKKGPETITFTRVAGEANAWRVTSPVFKTTTYSAKLRLMVNGRPCETNLALAPHGGSIVTVEGGPRFEVVRDASTSAYTFYALDEQINGKAYTIENPQVVVTTAEGPRTVTLVPVPGEQRAWRLAGLDAGIREPGDARLRFTLFGRSLETNVGLSGIGIGVR